MKKIKLLFSVLALLAGAGSAIAVTVDTQSSRPDMLHDWMDWNGQTVFWGMTQQQAQTFCPASINVCLRATDNVLIYTSGDLPW